MQLTNPRKFPAPCRVWGFLSRAGFTGGGSGGVEGWGPVQVFWGLGPPQQFQQPLAPKAPLEARKAPGMELHPVLAGSRQQ